MSIGTRLNRLRKLLATRRSEHGTYNEPDASAAPGSRQSNRLPTLLGGDIASDGTPARLRSSESQDQDR